MMIEKFPLQAEFEQISQTLSKYDDLIHDLYFSNRNRRVRRFVLSAAIVENLNLTLGVGVDKRNPHSVFARLQFRHFQIFFPTDCFARLPLIGRRGGRMKRKQYRLAS